MKTEKLAIEKAKQNLLDKNYLNKYGPRKIKVDSDYPVTYDNFVELMVSHGYDIEPNDNGDHRITGYGVCGWYIGLYNEEHHAPGYIFLDNAECYDKISKCPVTLQLPISAGDLFKSLKQIGSPAGLLISNTFSYHNTDIFIDHYGEK
jgi:hypothetical protein